MSRAARFVAHHWYVPVFAVILLGVWLLARTSVFTAEGGEVALLADLCLTAPVLYVLCYARKQPARTTALRALAIACSGVWIASWLIPASGQVLLPQLAPLRYIGLGVVILFELWLVITVTRLAFSGNASAEKLTEAGSMPPWMARALLWEANMWRAVWRFVRRKP